MKNLAQQRCFHHGQREAVACCPQCGRFFCRECITEHEDRVICASCLKKLTENAPRQKKRLQLLSHVLQGGIAVLTLWLVFYTLGRGLLSIPASFHDGTIWKKFIEEEP